VFTVVESALKAFAGGDNFSSLNASSRTDHGVHAFRNTFTVNLCRRHRHVGELRTPHSGKTVVNGLNFYLSDNGNDDIRVVGAIPVPEDFHARIDAMSRTYEYYILSKSSSEDRAQATAEHTSSSVGLYGSTSLFYHDRAWVVDACLDVKAMNLAAQLLRGTNDFSSFRNSGCQSVSPMRHMFKLKCEAFPMTFAPGFANGAGHIAPPPPSLMFTAVEPLPPPEIVKVTLQANAFVFRMCRNIVAALVKVGSGEMSVTDFATLIHARDRNLAPPTAPAAGLYLRDVHYADTVRWS